MYKVSVIVPIYGVEKYIAKCVHSLFQQTLKEIQYIFVDDCTLDSSINILKLIIEEYPQVIDHVTIIKNDSNQGLPQARKAGFKKAIGDYIIHIDSDDWIEIDMIENLYYKAYSNNFDLVWCDYYQESLNDSKYVNTYLESMDKIHIYKRLFSMNNNLHSGVWNKLVKRDIYFKNDVLFSSANQMEDFVLTIQNIYYSQRIGYLNKAMYHYRFVNNSLTWDPTRKIERINESYENLLFVTRFLENKLGKDIILLEPELSDYVNRLKVSIMMTKESRSIKKIEELRGFSNNFIFNKSSIIPFYHKVFLYLSTKNILFQYKLFDFYHLLKKNILKFKILRLNNSVL